jgi:hypothetical protein
MLLKVVTPIRPTIIRMTPTMSRLTPCICQSVAKVRMAPTAMRMMHPPRPMTVASLLGVPVVPVTETGYPGGQLPCGRTYLAARR